MDDYARVHASEHLLGEAHPTSLTSRAEYRCLHDDEDQRRIRQLPHLLGKHTSYEVFTDQFLDTASGTLGVRDFTLRFRTRADGNGPDDLLMVRWPLKKTNSISNDIDDWPGIEQYHETSRFETIRLAITAEGGIQLGPVIKRFRNGRAALEKVLARQASPRINDTIARVTTKRHQHVFKQDLDISLDALYPDTREATSLIPWNYFRTTM